MAFWLNAYNAFVLQTVIDRYPIRGTQRRRIRRRASRRFPGAFEQTKHPRGRPERDARRDREDHPAGVQGAAPVLALGRGARRQRPSAQRGLHRGAAAPQQLEAMSGGVRARGSTCSRSIGSPGWCRRRRSSAGTRRSSSPRYDKGATGPFAQRSPIERALVAFITPTSLPLEREFMEENGFKVTFQPFDWRLNDLTGGRSE